MWTPAKRNTKNLPVLVYFYGGGFVAGDALEPRYDGENMAKKGIVVVTANHSLHIFGFFAHPELSAEAPCQRSQLWFVRSTGYATMGTKKYCRFWWRP
ncbi:MAG: carboxylesterase family protein [Spirosomataceae bacterium]